MNRTQSLVLGKVLLCAAISTLAAKPALSFPGATHDQLAALLLDTPPELGGAKGLSVEQIQAANRWMDNPATKTGQYTNHAVGKTVHPTNHRHMRHNPLHASKALSGTGTVDPAKINITRLHKIADVAQPGSVAGTDRWEITPEMKQEAKKILDYVTKNKRLPQNLPSWVDKSGPVITDRARSIAEAGTKTADKAGGTVAAAGRFGKALKIGGGVALGRIVIEGGIATIRYANGDLSRGQYEDELVAVGIKAVGSGVLTSAALVCFTNPGTAVVFIVAVGACIVVDTVYGIVTAAFDKTEARAEFYRRLPPEFRNGLLVNLLEPDPAMTNFGRTYGPVPSGTDAFWEKRG